MLRVALNGRFTGTKQPTGTQTASFELFNALLREPADIAFVVFADPRFPGVASWGELERVSLVSTPFQDWSRGRAQLWEQFCSPLLASHHQCEVMHHPMNTSPAWQHGIRNIVTLHDLNFLLHPEWYSLSFRLVYDLCSLPGLRRCGSVVTISEHVRKQAAETLRLPSERLAMIHNGVKPLLATTPWIGNYLFAVNSLQPHKNLARLICAFRMIRSAYPDLELVMAGRPQLHFSSDPKLSKLLTTPGVRFTGYLSEEELANAYAGARAFCFPSLEEGFGLPILEAMALGCPVLTSNVSCLPEIAGPALQVDPTSSDAIAKGLQHLLSLSSADREKVISQGKEWVKHFSWKAAAAQYIKLYRQLALQ